MFLLNLKKGFSSQNTSVLFPTSQLNRLAILRRNQLEKLHYKAPLKFLNLRMTPVSTLVGLYMRRGLFLKPYLTFQQFYILFLRRYCRNLTWYKYLDECDLNQNTLPKNCTFVLYYSSYKDARVLEQSLDWQAQQCISSFRLVRQKIRKVVKVKLRAIKPEKRVAFVYRRLGWVLHFQRKRKQNLLKAIQITLQNFLLLSSKVNCTSQFRYQSYRHFLLWGI